MRRGPGSVRCARRNSPRGHEWPESAHSEALSATTSADVVDIGEHDSAGLRRLLWQGVSPVSLRPLAWRLVLGHASPQQDRREREERRKREEYIGYTRMYPYTSHRGLPRDNAPATQFPQEDAILRQLALDLPRHSLALYHTPALCDRLERVLFVWSLRHPATSYVQGMDDVACVFLSLFLVEQLAAHDGGADVGPAAWARAMALVEAPTADKARLEAAIAELPDDALDAAESDTFWCAGRVLGWVQHHYVFGTPGIRTSVAQVQHILERCDGELCAFLGGIGVEPMQYLYQWIHSFFVRYLGLPATLRLFDTFIATGDTFADFNAYLCAALLVELRPALVGREMDEVLPMLQAPMGHLPQRQTADGAWLEAWIAQAHLLRLRFPDSHKGALSGTTP